MSKIQPKSVRLINVNCFVRANGFTMKPRLGMFEKLESNYTIKAQQK